MERRVEMAKVHNQNVSAITPEQKAQLEKNYQIACLSVGQQNQQNSRESQLVIK